MMMLNQLTEEIALADGTTAQLGSEEREAGTEPLPEVDVLREFRLEDGLPIWVYQVGAASIEKRLVLPNHQNSSYISYRILSGAPSVRLRLRPKVHMRPHEAPVESARPERYGLSVVEDRYEISSGPSLPPLRLKVWGPPATFVSEHTPATDVLYRVEDSRGYGARGGLWSPGYFEMELPAEASACLVASTEPWETLLALRPHQVLRFEDDRHRYLLGKADGRAADPVAAELMLAADAFIVMPRGRLEDVARAQAAGDDVRTVIAGYHWFTDWGRDTMISLEGLTLATGRHDEARWILRTFSHHLRDGLIPNLFPEGESQGLYHTADATLWYFHALDRYLQATDDRQTLRQLLPLLLDVIGHHVRGTRFGIGLDPEDGLLRQGQEEYQLTWMDAKVDGWVVTPRRGKAVEINGLWYNALRLAQSWMREEGDEAKAAELGALADHTYRSFNERFWYAAGGHLYDVVDGQAGDDVACRPNQLLAFSLPHPVLDPRRWEHVLRVVQERLLTPVGLRSLAPGHPDYQRKILGRSPLARCRLPPGHRVGLAHRTLRRCLAEGAPRPGGRGPRLPAGVRHPPGRRLHRVDQRGLRRRAPVHAARLRGPGLERGRGPPLLAAHGRGPCRWHIACCPSSRGGYPWREPPAVKQTTPFRSWRTTTAPWRRCSSACGKTPSCSASSRRSWSFTRAPRRRSSTRPWSWSWEARTPAWSPRPAPSTRR